MTCVQTNTSPFTLQITSSLKLTSNNTFTIEIRNLFVNPQSTNPIGTFDIHTYDSNSNQLERLSTSSLSQKLAISEPNSFVSYSVSRTNHQNKNSSNYTFTL